MDVQPTRLPEVLLVTPHVFSDERGYFFEAWQQNSHLAAGIGPSFVQDNHSHSVRNTLRGLHFQVRQPQGKLVRVTNGEVFDVAVDLRRESPRFGQWVGVRLSDANHQMLWVPPGFAHGYLTLSAEADVLYKCSDYYTPQFECAVRWNDSTIGVNWPLSEGMSPILSPRDSQAPSLGRGETF